MADEKLYSDSLTWQRVAEWPPWRCPRCQRLPDDGFAWVTGDALPRPAKDQPERYDATLLWGDCTACGEALYRLEITLLPHRPPRGWVFQNDSSWQAYNVTRYRVSRGRQTWNTYHVRHPHGVRLLPVAADVRAVKQDLSWLDIHVFEPLWAEDLVQGLYSGGEDCRGAQADFVGDFVGAGVAWHRAQRLPIRDRLTGRD